MMPEEGEGMGEGRGEFRLSNIRCKVYWLVRESYNAG